MADAYTWNHLKEDRSYRLPGPDHLGWWAAAAMAASILLHIGVFFALERMKIALRFEQLAEISTNPVVVQRVEVTPPADEARSQPAEEIVQPQENATLLEEVDLLNALPKDQEIDIKPDAIQPAYALRVQQPAASGTPDAPASESTANMDFEADLPEFGRELTPLKPSEVGRVTVDPGAVQTDDQEFGRLTEQILKHGAGGKVERGKLDGVVSLEEMLELPSNILLAKKTLLPSDLLFEFNSHQLRESAKVGLMKLALLIDRNPGLHCWIEGHTDLVGGDDFNLKLSIRRSEEVKSYLVDSMRMDSNRIHTMGFGKFKPIVTSGNTEQQSINRRVEIRMRKTPPTEADRISFPKRASVMDEPDPSPAGKGAPPPATQPPKAILVKPRWSMPVDDTIVDPAPPRAVVVPSQPSETTPVTPPRAAPVIEESLQHDSPPGTFRAVPVQE